jgi:hypothetical protein
VTSASAANGVLTVTYGPKATANYFLANQQPQTSFALQSDGDGGTDLFLTPTPPQPPLVALKQLPSDVYTAEYGSAPSATELNVLTLFTQAQYTYGQQIGVQDAVLYAYQSLGAALAGATQFQNTFGPTVGGDVQFVVDAYASVFGQPGSGAQIQQFVDQLNYLEALYTAAGTFGSASNIDLLARGAVYGQMLGIEQEGQLVSPQPTANISNTGSGAWEATGTWNTGTIPTANDDVSLSTAGTVTVNQPGDTAHNVSVGDSGMLVATGQGSNIAILGDLNDSGSVSATNSAQISVEGQTTVTSTGAVAASDFGQITFMNSVSDAGMIIVGPNGTIQINGDAIGGTGTLGLLSTLVLNGNATTNVQFNGTDESLVLGHSTTYTGAIINFFFADSIDAKDIMFNSLQHSFNPNTNILTLSDSRGTAMLQFEKLQAGLGFTFSSDGPGGGTLITGGDPIVGIADHVNSHIV